MKNRKNQRNSLFSLAGIAVFAFIILLFSDIFAKPFILKSVDGSWLPMIAQSWVAKNGGVLVKVADGIKPNDLRKEMLAQMPDLSIEILGKDLFFPTTTPDSLFELLKNIDLDVAEAGVRRQSMAETSEMFVKKSGENTSRDEYTEAVVENVVFDEKNEKIILTVRIQQRAKTGMFPKLYGVYRIEHTYKMKNDIVDPADVKNMAFLPLITAKKGSKITFIPEKLDSRILTITPDFKIK
ncbi:hypothetical protein IJG44_00205 [bacterium]|nr:hypothetical protein [bacterium]MBQ4437688.1 hypothetical protein [bacterium]